jgi:hypothetical protein
MNIYQKLIEVRKSCEYLKKDNAGFQFKYVSSSQTLGTLRAAMDTHQLLLVPRVTSHETRDHTTKKGEHEYFTIATMSFTWINAEKPEEQIECPWLGQGLDNGEKGVGKAMTYAEKYFLLKFFNIATDKDDPDAFQKKNEDKESTPKDPTKDALRDQAANEYAAELCAQIDLCTTKEKLSAWWAANAVKVNGLLPVHKAKVEKYWAEIKKILNEQPA